MKTLFLILFLLSPIELALGETQPTPTASLAGPPPGERPTDPFFQLGLSAQQVVEYCQYGLLPHLPPPLMVEGTAYLIDSLNTYCGIPLDQLISGAEQFCRDVSPAFIPAELRGILAEAERIQDQLRALFRGGSPTTPEAQATADALLSRLAALSARWTELVEEDPHSTLRNLLFCLGMDLRIFSLLTAYAQNPHLTQYPASSYGPNLVGPKGGTRQPDFYIAYYYFGHVLQVPTGRFFWPHGFR